MKGGGFGEETDGGRNDIAVYRAVFRRRYGRHMRKQ